MARKVFLIGSFILVVGINIASFIFKIIGPDSLLKVADDNDYKKMPEEEDKKEEPQE